MDALYTAFFADPLRYIGYIFAIFAAFGFGMFLAGIITGFRHLVRFSESDTHIEHARVRAMWGVLLTMSTLGGWEVVRVIAGAAPVGYLWLSFFLLIPVWIPAIRALMGAGGH